MITFEEVKSIISEFPGHLSSIPGVFGRIADNGDSYFEIRFANNLTVRKDIWQLTIHLYRSQLQVLHYESDLNTGKGK